MTDNQAQEAQSVDKPTDEASAQEATIPEWAKDPTKAYAEIRNAREEAKSHRVMAQELKKRLDEIEATQKANEENETRKKGDFETLLTKKEKELNDLRQQFEAERMNALRLRIGAEAGLPTALMERLRGSNEAELKADAEALKALIPTQENKATGKGSTTVTAPGQGAKTGETYEQRRQRIYGPRRGGGGTSFG